MAKIPGLFNKSYSPEKLAKKILNRIHIPKDRELIESLFVENEDGKWELTGDLEEDILTLLQPMAKTIKKNSGLVTTWKAILLLVVGGGAAVFNIFFLDGILEKNLEKGFEAVFNAEVDFVSADLSLTDGTFSFDSLTIADQNSPMTNLIETGPALFHLDMAELSRKRVRIKEASLRGIQWGTRRSESGALLEKGDRDESGEAAESEDKESSAILSPLAPTTEDFDYEALLKEQKNNLTTIKAVEDATAAAEALVEEWSAHFETEQADIESLTEEILAFRDLSPKNITSIEDGAAMVAQVEGVYTKVESKKNDLIALSSEFQEDRARIADLTDSIKGSVANDLDYLEGFLDFSMDDAGAIVSSTAEGYIRNRWNNYYEKGLKGYEIYERFADSRKEKEPEKEGLSRSYGRVISFPVPLAPTFRADKLLIEGGTTESGALWAEVLNISNDQEILDKETSFQVLWEKEDFNLSLNGYYDGRVSSELPLMVNVHTPANPIELPAGVPALEIDSLSGKMDVSGRIQAASGAVRSNLDLVLGNIDIDIDRDSGLIAEAVADILGTIEEVEIKTFLNANLEGINDLVVTSDLDQILSDRIGGYLEEKAQELQTELSAKLNDYIDSFLEDNQIVSDAMDTLGLQSLDQISSVEDLETFLDDKKAEYENVADQFLTDVEAEAQARIDEAEAELQRQADEAEADLQRQAEAAEAEAQRQIDAAAEEAKTEIEDQAKEATDSLLKGFGF